MPTMSFAINDSEKILKGIDQMMQMIDACRKPKLYAGSWAYQKIVGACPEMRDSPFLVESKVIPPDVVLKEFDIEEMIWHHEP